MQLPSPKGPAVRFLGTKFARAEDREPHDITGSCSTDVEVARAGVYGHAVREHDVRGSLTRSVRVDIRDHPVRSRCCQRRRDVFSTGAATQPDTASSVSERVVGVTQRPAVDGLVGSNSNRSALEVELLEAAEFKVGDDDAAVR